LLVVAAQADSDVAWLRIELPPRWYVASEERKATVCFQRRIDDVLGPWRGWISVFLLPKRCHIQATAEDILVKLHRLPCVAGKADVRAEKDDPP
jgi:hypothetical protein